MRDVPGRQSPKDCPNSSGLDSAPDSALGPAVVVQTVLQAPKQHSRPANRAELQADRAQCACLLTELHNRRESRKKILCKYSVNTL